MTAAREQVEALPLAGADVGTMAEGRELVGAQAKGGPSHTAAGHLQGRAAAVPRGEKALGAKVHWPQEHLGKDTERSRGGRGRGRS